MMARWQDVIDSEPEFARRAQALFDGGKHKTLATVRKDGSPRISGIEMQIGGGEAWLGMMANSQKLADVRRDPRIALHSPSAEPPEDPQRGNEWSGDAKLAGRLVLMDASLRKSLGADDEPGDYFTIDLEEVVITRVGDPADHLVVQLWRPSQALKTMRA